MLLNIPAVQHRLSILVAKELKNVLNTELSIGRIDIGLLNRIIIDDVLLKDQSGKEMLKVTRLSAKFDIIPLFNGKIAISSVQLFGFNISLNKLTPESKPNFQFVLDAFASKDTVKKESNLDLRINSVLIRRGKLAYDVLSEPETPGKFNAKHVKVQNIIANISLKVLRKDSVNAYIKRLSLEEQSGFDLQKLSLRVLGNTKQTKIENFAIALPNTMLQMDTISFKYDSLGGLKNVAKDVRFAGKMLPSYVTLKDISCFVPALGNFADRLDLDMEFDGTVDQLNCPRLQVSVDDNILIRGDVGFQDLSNTADAYVYGKLSRCDLNRAGVDFVIRNLAKDYSGTPAILKRLGDVSFRGEVSGYFNDLVTYGVVRTSIGSVRTDVKLSSNKEKAYFSYSGSVKTDDLELGKLLGNDKVGSINFNLDVKGMHYKHQLPSINMKGLITSVEYSKYNYENIELDGEYKRGGFDGKISLNDPNGKILLNGNFNLAQKVPTFNFKADVRKLHPNALNLTKKYEDSEFSLKMDANFTGNSIDNMIGEINVDSISFKAPAKDFFMKNMNITATQNGDGEKQLSLNSEFITAVIKGKYSYQTIPLSVLKTVERYIPSLLSINSKKKEPDNDFSFDVHVYNTNILTEVFDIPLTVYTHSTVKGYFNDKAHKLRIEGYFPSFKYKENWFESGMILCENPSDQINCRVRASNHMKKGSVLNLSVDAIAQNDILKTSINWGNDGQVTYSGKFSAITNFFKTAGEHPILQANIDVQPTKVILNDSTWNIHPSRIAIDSGRVYINNFLFNHKDQYLRINGKLTKNAEDTVKVDLKDINLSYVFDIVQFHSVDFGGMASGTATASGVFKNPEMNAKLFVKNFSLNQGILGNMNIYGTWDKEVEGISLDADMKEEGISHTTVKGYVSPKRKGLDLHIGADSTNIAFLQRFMKSIASDVHGRANGKVRLFGGFKSLNLDGAVYADAGFKIDVLNAGFLLKDSVRLIPDNIQFRNARVFDTEGHEGTVNGDLFHHNLKDLSYRFQMSANNMLVFNTKEDPDFPFYGTVYGTGNVQLNGSSEGLNVDVAMTTNRKTNFVYMIGGTSSAASNQFITFIDKTPKRQTRDSIPIIEDIHKPVEEPDIPMDIRLNILVDATPDATMKLVMDPVAGDYIGGRGNGNIRIDFYNKGDVKMFGSYTITQGVYKFSLQEVIRKDFTINSGSTITFNGDPFDANLDIRAAYTVNSASLSDLGINFNQQNNVKVNCLMDLTGNLLKPNLQFDIELPNDNEEVKNAVKSAISTDEQMNMQILYLLGIGKFYTYDYNNNGQSSNAMSSVLSSTISGQLNNMLSQAINSSNWNFGTNLSTGDKGWTDMEIEGILSGQLLNNRLLINGNFGYRDNPTANTNFVGDFDIEYLLTKSGDIRLKAYNQTNDRYFTKTTLTTQGVGLIYKKDFNTWKELFRRTFKKKAESKQSADTIKKDTVTIPQSKNKRER